MSETTAQPLTFAAAASWMRRNPDVNVAVVVRHPVSRSQMDVVERDRASYAEAHPVDVDVRAVKGRPVHVEACVKGLAYDVVWLVESWGRLFGLLPNALAATNPACVTVSEVDR